MCTKKRIIILSTVTILFMLVIALAARIRCIGTELHKDVKYDLNNDPGHLLIQPGEITFQGLSMNSNNQLLLNWSICGVTIENRTSRHTTPLAITVSSGIEDLWGGSPVRPEPEMFEVDVK